MIGILRGFGFALLVSTTTAGSALRNEPQLRYNASVKVAQSGTLLTRDLFELTERDYYTCPSGYDTCSTDYSRCCPSGPGNGCCDNHSCTEPGDTCCVVGTCPKGWDCCGNAGYCSPSDGECCNGGYYCTAGNRCRIWNGEAVCCPSSGCIGSSNGGSLGSTVGSGGETEATTTDVDETTSTSTYSYTEVDYDYYYTTYYWSFWFYFWTSTYPYKVSTVTSTETTTTDIWSVYATNSAEAHSSFSSSYDHYTFSTPFSATYLQAETGPGPTSSVAPTGQLAGDGTGGQGSGPGSAANSVVPSGPFLIISVGFAAAIGILAVGL